MVQVEEFTPAPRKDGLVIVAFPSTGSAVSIAAHFLLEQIKLPLVGHLPVPELSSVVGIQDGRATAAIRVFGGKVACKLDKACPTIHVITADLPVPPTAVEGVAKAILAWAQKGECALVLPLEAVQRLDGDEVPDVFCASADPAALKLLTKAGVAPMGRALVAGLGARLMLEAPASRVPCAAMMVEAIRDYPDGRAAAALISALSKVVPDVAMDPKPLEREAKRLESEIRRATQPTEPQAHPSPNSFI